MSKKLDQIKKRSEIAEYGTVLHLVINECIGSECVDYDKIHNLAYGHFRKSGADIANAAHFASQVVSDVVSVMSAPDNGNPDQSVLPVPSAGVVDYVFPSFL